VEPPPPPPAAAPPGTPLPPLLHALGGATPARRTGSFRALLGSREARSQFF